MRRLILGVLLVGLVGCAAPSGVIKAVEELSVPVSSIADRYAALVQKLGEINPETVTPEKQTLMMAPVLESMEQFDELLALAIEWLKGEGLFTGQRDMLDKLGESLRDIDEHIYHIPLRFFGDRIYEVAVDVQPDEVVLDIEEPN